MSVTDVLHQKEIEVIFRFLHISELRRGEEINKSLLDENEKNPFTHFSNERFSFYFAKLIADRLVNEPENTDVITPADATDIGMSVLKDAMRIGHAPATLDQALAHSMFESIADAMIQIYMAHGGFDSFRVYCLTRLEAVVNLAQEQNINPAVYAATMGDDLGQIVVNRVHTPQSYKQLTEEQIALLTNPDFLVDLVIAPMLQCQYGNHPNFTEIISRLREGVGEHIANVRPQVEKWFHEESRRIFGVAA